MSVGWVRRHGVAIAILGLAVVFPFVVSEFWVVQIGISSLWLAIVAMSLTFLASYGGMISLAQTALYGVAGYAIAILTVENGVNPWLAILVALLLTVAVGAVLGTVAARTYGIYFLMITLAYGVFAYYFANQARQITGGHGGINGVLAPSIGGISLLDRTNLYFAALLAAVLCYLGLRYLVRTPFGIALQGVRDDPLRMSALGFNVPLYRILAFVAGAFVAGVGGVFAVWYNVRISPGSIDLTRTVDVLVVSVIGGLYRLEGAFVGAVAFTLLSNYANEFTDRYNMLIGVIFLVVLLLSPGGLLGMWEQFVRRFRTFVARLKTRDGGREAREKG